jgi:hypothetical protein
MSAGVIKLLTRGVPADAPKPKPGETEWYSGGQYPVQIGVYRRLSVAGTTVFSYFDGGHWLWNQPHPDRAVRVPSTEPSLVQNLPWCGLVIPARAGYGPMPTAPTERPAA